MKNSFADVRPNVSVPRLMTPNWRKDLMAGFLVFLIALPLCLGIAVASGFPPMAGIISAIVGGLLVSRINGSCLTITGPAAGLIVVILTSVQSLGEGNTIDGYRYTLAAIVVAGLLQIVLGYLKAGRLAAFFPNSVVHGMLAAIGIIIITKQLPVMVGVQIQGGGMLSDIALIPHALTYFVPKVAVIALIGLVILIGWPQIQHQTLSKIPAPILVIVAGMLLGRLLGLSHLQPEPLFRMPDDLLIGGSVLVSISDSLLGSLVFPDFGKLASVAFWESVISICLVGSLESLLSAAAVDKLDPKKRYTDLNRDLAAVGVGNAVSGMLGGLPLISEIVRSSANIDAGAQSGWANFFHGAFLLVFVLLFPAMIGSIPLASLAALLVYTGFRLASPQAFARTMDLGVEQMAIFLVTIVGILASNLLAGVAIGIAAKLMLHLVRGVPIKSLLSISYRLQQQSGDVWVVSVIGSAIFSNFVSLKSDLAGLPDGRKVIFDLSNTDLIDHTVMEFIDHYRDDYVDRGGLCEVIGLSEHRAYGDHELAARKRNTDVTG